MTITKGDSVIWKNKDDMTHTATRKDLPSFETGPIASGTESIDIKFDDLSGEGGFEYYCRPLPIMKGKIFVVNISHPK